MSLADAATAVAPNGAAGPPVASPPTDKTPTAGPAARAQDTGTDTTPADDAAPPCSAAMENEAGALTPRDRRRFRVVPNFARTSKQVLDLDAIAALKAEARREVEGTTLSLYEIARRMDIAASTLSKWKAEEHWVRPDGAPTQPHFGGKAPPRKQTPEERSRDMIGKLYRVFVRQAGDLEARAARPGATTEEKDARTLSVLAKTLETLIALDRDDGAKTAEPEPADRDRLNADLARRIKEWAERGE